MLLNGVVVYNRESIIQRDEVYTVFRRMSLDLSGGHTIYHTRKGNQKRIPASAYRPFDRGSRNCIGQGLANIEARIVLVCVVRRYT